MHLFMCCSVAVYTYRREGGDLCIRIQGHLEVGQSTDALSMHRVYPECISSPRLLLPRLRSSRCIGPPLLWWSHCVWAGDSGCLISPQIPIVRSLKCLKSVCWAWLSWLRAHCWASYTSRSSSPVCAKSAICDWSCCTTWSSSASAPKSVGLSSTGDSVLKLRDASLLHLLEALVRRTSRSSWPVSWLSSWKM